MLLVAAVNADRANAYNFTSGELDSITQDLRRGGSYFDAPVCGQTCSDLWLSEHRPIPYQPASNELHAELLRAREEVGALSRLKNLGTISVRRAGPVAGAFFTGMLLGSGANAKWLHFGLDNDGVSEANYVGSDISWSPNPVTVFTSDPGDPGETDLIIPANKWRLKPAFSGGIGSVERWFVYSPGIACDYPDFPTPTGFSLLSGATRCFNHYGPGGTPFYDHGSVKAAYTDEFGPGFAPGAIEDYTGSGSQPVDQSQGVVPAQTQAQTRALVDSEFDQHPERYPMLRPWYAHEFHPGSEPDPTVQVTAVPDCTGLSYNACITALQNAGFGVYHRVSRSFDTAIPMPQAQPDQVLTQLPVAGAQVRVDTDVALDTNPANAAEPRLVPPLGAEHGDYAGQLGTLGLVGHERVLTDASSNPDYGPNAVVHSSPAPGSRAHAGDDVNYDTNPATAPAAGAPLTFSAPAIPPIDLSPLGHVTSCNAFPFGVFCWLYTSLGGWQTGGSCPQFSVPFTRGNLPFDFCQFEPAMVVVRPVIVVVSLLGLVWLVATAAMGLGGSGTEADQ